MKTSGKASRKPSLQPTLNSLPVATRTKVVPLLAARLAEAGDLKLQAKQAHWNLKGPNFIALHELFDQVAAHADVWADDLAERIVQLGGIAEGTVQAIVRTSTLPAYPLDILAEGEHLEALAAALAAFAKGVSEAIDRAAALGDADTADLFTEVSRAADKDLWFLESHLHAD